MQRTGRASLSSSFESVSAARPAAERRSVMQHRQHGFRRDGRPLHRWRQWVREHRALIDELGLPADVVETRRDFDHLLLHQYSRAGWERERPWFELFDRDDPRYERFWELLEDYIKVFYAGDVESARAMLASRFPPPGGSA